MSTVSKMAVKGVSLNPVAQAQNETARRHRSRHCGGSEENLRLLTVSADRRKSQMPEKPVGSKHRPGKDSLQDSFHAGLPAAGSASVFHSVLEGRGEEGAGDRHEAGIALAGGSR